MLRPAAQVETLVQWGRTVAQPAATQRQLQAARRVVAAPAEVRPEPRVEIDIRGQLGFAARDVELRIIKVLEDTGMQLSELADAECSRPGMWSSVAAATSDAPSGRLRLHLSTAGQAEALHDKAFQLGPDLISLSVSDDADLVAQATNGRRGARRRAGPPVATSSA